MFVFLIRRSINLEEMATVVRRPQPECVSNNKKKEQQFKAVMLQSIMACHMPPLYS